MLDLLEFRILQEDIDAAVAADKDYELRRGTSVNYRCPIAQALKRMGYTCDVRHINNISVDNIKFSGNANACWVMDEFDAGNYDQLTPVKVILTAEE